MKTTNIYLDKNTLAVNDLDSMTEFYHNIIGLEIIDEMKTITKLGVDGNVMIELTVDETYTLSETSYTGLFHTALLLPNEKYLGYLLEHFINKEVSISGLGDHLYSQAIYLEDPEGNGIEIYADRPQDQWIIHHDGTIEGGTFPVNLERLMSIRYTQPWNGLPKGTRLGHVHLQVNSIEQAKKFYIDVLGFELKTEMPGAIFISHRGYHHDLGINEWSGRSLMPKPDSVSGLKTLHLYTTTYDEIKQQLDAHNTAYHEENNTIFMEDPAGIKIQIRG